MASYIGNKEIVSMYLGNRDIDSFSIGDSEIWNPEPPVETTSARYFKFDGNKVTSYIGEDTKVIIPKSYSIERIPDGYMDVGNGCALQNPDLSNTWGTSLFSRLKSYCKEFIISDGTHTVDITKEGDVRISVVFNNKTSFRDFLLKNNFNNSNLKCLYMSMTTTSASNYATMFNNLSTAYNGFTYPLSFIYNNEVTTFASYSRSELNTYLSGKTDLIIGTEAQQMPKYITNYIDGNDYRVTILSNTFNGNTTLEDVTLLNNITNIASSTFAGCTNLTSLRIAGNITSIGGSAFNNCVNMENLYIPSLSSWCNVSLLNQSSHPFYASTKSTGIYVGEDETELTDLTISDTEVGSYLFYNCSNLISVNISDNVQTVGFNVFKNCANLQTLHIGSNLNSIGADTFSGCPNLMYITVDPNNAVWDSRDNCNAIIHSSGNSISLGCRNTTIPNTVIAIGVQAFSYCTSLTNFSIPSSIKTIDQRAFVGCSGLTNIVIPDTVELVDQGAFEDCTGLTSVTIGKNISKIYARTFKNCTGISNITWNSTNLTEIDSEAFYGCTSLITLTNMPNTVKVLGPSCFANCSNLQTVRVSNNLEDMVDGTAFNNCPKLWNSSYNTPTQYIYYIKNNTGTEVIAISTGSTTLAGFLFKNITFVAKPIDMTFSQYVNIPKSVKKIYCELPEYIDTTYYGQMRYSGTISQWAKVYHSYDIREDNYSSYCPLTCSSVAVRNAITISGVSKIEYNAFKNLSQITSVTIDNTVEDIGTQAFMNCYGLQSITIQATVPPQIGYYSFYNTNSCPIYVPAESVELYKNTENWVSYASRIQAIS